MVAACVAATPTPILTAKHRDDHASSGVDPPAAKHSNKPRKNKHNPNHWRFLVVGEVLMVKKNPVNPAPSWESSCYLNSGLIQPILKNSDFPKVLWGSKGCQYIKHHKTLLETVKGDVHSP